MTVFAERWKEQRFKTGNESERRMWRDRERETEIERKTIERANTTRNKSRNKRRL